LGHGKDRYALSVKLEFRGLVKGVKRNGKIGRGEKIPIPRGLGAVGGSV